MINQWKNKTIARIGMQGKLSPMQGGEGITSAEDDTDLIIAAQAVAEAIAAQAETFLELTPQFKQLLGNYSTATYPIFDTDLDLSDEQRKARFDFLNEIALHMKHALQAENLIVNEYWFKTVDNILGVWEEAAENETDTEKTEREKRNNTSKAAAENFIGWLEEATQNVNLSPVLNQAAYSYAESTNTAKEFYEVGAPGDRKTAYDRDTVDALMNKYGLSLIDLQGPNGLGVLDWSSSNSGLQLEEVFDIASTAANRYNRGLDKYISENDAVKWAIDKYTKRRDKGDSHMISKIGAFDPKLARRISSAFSGTMGSQLSIEEADKFYEIMGTDYLTSLTDMDISSEVSKTSNAVLFDNYLSQSISRETPMTVQGGEMREAARTLAASWMLRPMDDEALDKMIDHFGQQMRHYQQAAGALSGGIVEEPSMAATVADTLRGTEEYTSLYGGKSDDMTEEEWANKFDTSGLTGGTSRVGQKVGMQTGSSSLGRQAAISDTSEGAKGGTFYRRLNTLRKAFL